MFRAILMAAFTTIVFSILLVSFLSKDDDQSWPYTSIDGAERVSLSAVSDLLSEDAEGRRAAIVGDRIYVERSLADGGVDSDAQDGEMDDPVAFAELPYPSSMFTQDLIETSSFDIELFEDKKVNPITVASLIIQVIFLTMIVLFLLHTLGKAGGNFGTEPAFEIVETKDLKTSLADVAGLENARSDIQEVIDLLKDEGRASIAGGRLPRGLLFDGPPGTGKTLLARAMAKEAGVNFISVDASSLSQMFVGLGAIKVRRLFRKARKLSPAIIFIDEIDAIGGARGNGGRNADQDRENTLNALLTEMDGFSDRDDIFVIAATNRPDMLDPALSRPGRIDRKITMQLPDIKARRDILAVHCKGLTLAEDVNLDRIASTTYQMSGADLANLTNEAALCAGRAGRKEVTMDDFREARDRILLPRSGGSISMLDDERQITAYHEAGHAIAAIFSKHSDPVEKVTIAPQGRALGFVMQSPDRDRVFESKARLKARIKVAVAGREAEKMFFGEDMVTTGAASDIRQATAIARAMVTQYGMSNLGFINLEPDNTSMLISSSHTGDNPVMKEIESIISKSIEDCATLLKAHQSELKALAEALLEQETLTGAEVEDVIAKNKGDYPDDKWSYYC